MLTRPGWRAAQSIHVSAFQDRTGSSIGSSTDTATPSSRISARRFGAVWVARMPWALMQPRPRSRFIAPRSASSKLRFAYTSRSRGRCSGR